VFELLPTILDEEGTSFYRIDNRWKPMGIIPDPYRRNLLKDAQVKFNRLEAATDELQQLDRAPLYVKLLNRMRASIKRAQFAWRTDDLELIRNIASFFVDYGHVLQNLRIDQARGRLSNT
jgi:hypothetical protein